MKMLVTFNHHLRQRHLISQRGYSVRCLRQHVAGDSVFNILFVAESNKLLGRHLLGLLHKNLSEHRNFLVCVLAFLCSCRIGPHNFTSVPVKLLYP